MRSFFKKEWDHYFLTNKWLIFFTLFIALGILNPLTAKITPMLVENMLGSEFSNVIGEPTAIDSWLQFFKNVPQLGLIAFLLMMANSMSKELQDGTLPIFLAKGLKRKSVIAAKLLFHTMMWTIGYVTAIGITYVYTIYYWDQSIVEQLPVALLGIYLFSLLFIFITFTGNTIMNSTMGGLGLSGIVLVILIFWNTFFDSTWNPFILFGQLDERLMGNVSFAYVEPFITVMIVMAICVLGSMLHFNKRSL